MVSLHILGVAALAALFQFSCSSQNPASSFVGRWQYIQSPDKEGEVLDLEVSSGRWRGILNGLERAGEHGLFYYVVETENLAVRA